MRTLTNRLVAMFFLPALWSIGARAEDGSLAPPEIERIRREFAMDPYARAMRNALTATGINAIAENRDILSGHNTRFSHKIKTKGISNQKSSGRCWLFAGLNTIKPILLQKLGVDDFEFSQIYLQFWDKMEKANNFLECMIEFRDRDLMDRAVVFLLRDPCPDGGYWENFVDLVAKYGVLPKEAMAETANSESTAAMNRILARILRKSAIDLRGIYKETGSVKRMRKAKAKVLADVYRVLVLSLGEPPTEFTWQYKPKVAGDAESEKKSDVDYKVEQKWTDRRIFTPASFYSEFVQIDLREYVNLADDPVRPKGRHYEIALTKNLYDGRNAHYANVDIQALKGIVAKVLLDNKAVYFAADVSPDQDRAKGIMARGLYDYESVYNADLGLTKTERILFRDSTINHGMAFIGVDLHGGKPVKWLVENSWGAEHGDSGLWTMYDDWFDDNVYNVILHRSYVPAEILGIFEQPAEELPVWDPMW